MKLRVRPFASLRSGKIVIDAILYQPSLLVAQKEDFTWLGIPSSELALQRHSSIEEGIDYRTKVRRVAREAAAASWVKEREKGAMEAAEIGYIVPQQGSVSSGDAAFKEDDGQYIDGASSPLDEWMHLRDHNCIDTVVGDSIEPTDQGKSL